MAVAVKHGDDAKRGVEARFEALVLDFLAYLEFERGLSRNTLDAYRSDLLQYGAFLKRTGVPPLEADHATLTRFVTELANEVASTTLQRKIACLRSFHRHLRREGVLEHDPT